MTTIATVLELKNNNRHCFLTQVHSIRKHSRPVPVTREDGIQIYEAEVRTKGKVYFSTHQGSAQLNSGDTVQLNSLYAAKLSLSDEDPLLLQPVRAALPSAKKVFVEPLSVDDWEIVEKNSRHIENILLDQIRVIWPGQVFPLWIYRSACVFMKIVSVEPMAFCVVLEYSTDLMIAPKIRNLNPPKSLGLSGPVATPALPPQRQLATSHPSSGGHKDQDSSLNETPLDTLEPRPNIKSPSRSPRLSTHRKRSMKHQNFSSYNERSSEVNLKPMLRRQSSLMESVMRYVFGFMEKKEDYDDLSESDASSGIDYTLEKLPSRNGVLRVQPMKLKGTLEQTMPIPKADVHKQTTARHMNKWTPIGSPSLKDFAGERNENNSVPFELFQPTTVYVDTESTKMERDLHPFLPRLPYNLIAKLQRLPSPQEKAEASAKTSKKGKEGQEKTSASSSSSAPQPKEKKAAHLNKKDPAADGQPPQKDEPEIENISASCYVRVVVIDRKAGLTDEAWQDAADRLLSEQPLMTGHVIVPDLLRRQLKLDATGSVWLQTGQLEFVIPKKICIYPLSPVPRMVPTEVLISAFRSHIKICANEDHPLVIFQGLFLRFMIAKDNALEVQITFYGENDLANPTGVSMLSELNIDSVLILVEKNLQEDKMGVINPLLNYSKASDFDPIPPTVKLKHLGGLEKVAAVGLAHLQACLGSRPVSRTTFLARSGLCHGILLITGPKGSGKSSLSKALCRKMAQVPTMAHITLVDCKILRGKTVTHIQKILETIFDEAAWRQPAIMVFDNLDAIMSNPTGPESEMNGESIYSAKNSQVFQGLIKYEMENNSRLGVIATCCSKSNLHTSLTSSRGCHIVEETLHIGSPDQEVRSKILGCILQHHNSVSMETLKTINLQPIAVKTEGFVARDLECLINRAIHNRLVKDPEAACGSKVTLTQDDCEEVLETFKPVSIRGVPLHKAGELGWEDVGGLNDVKKDLIETLKWPSKYPQLFNSCPLRLRSGILLYGAPGTGKTLLAGIVAKECELNFISIKGPELLSKYIGASEQAVRDLFVRAQSAKPCILFFDEFDSIAPKRGHDSTGVTDRVVNQMLTQLDGVEGLQGVYVLAATNRPDLIDPALLRPGRLDKSLLCSMPDEVERCAILRALTNKMHLSPDVKLEEIASMCEHFTGADLKALLYNAQLKAIHEKSYLQIDEDPTMVRIKADDDECPAVVQATEMFDEDFRNKLEEVRGRSNSTKTSPEVLPLSEPRRFREASEESSVSDQSKTTETKSSAVSKGRSGSLDVDLNSSEISDVQSDSSGKEAATTNVEEEVDALQESGNSKTKLWFSEDGNEVLKGADYIEEESEVIVSKLDNHKAQRQLLNGSVPKNDAAFDGIDDVDGPLSPVLEEPRVSERSNTFISLTSTPKKLTEIPMLNIESIEEDAINNIQELPPLRMKVSASMNLPDPSQTYPPSSRRKRSFERTQSCTEAVKETTGIEAKTLTVDKPVTVYSSLGMGLATLSPEDEARYMAIAREIVRRDDRLFEVANNRRRTSFMQASRTSHLMEVCHRHLVEAARDVRPSVTAQERAKYLHIYEKFVSSRAAGFEKPKADETEAKRTTLA